MQWPSHGGQPEYIKQLFQIPKEGKAIDFSANLNPLGPPQWLKSELTQFGSKLVTYPDPTYKQSRESIAQHEGLTRSQVLVTNGGAEAIFLVAKRFQGKKILIVQPTFVEYEKACQHYNIQVEEVFLDQEGTFDFPLQEVLEWLPHVGAIFICRPNNPTGTVVPEHVIRLLLEQGLRNNTTVIVDEAFVDFLPEEEAGLTKWLGEYPNLILLRSLTKMYTIPAIRIGYVLATEEIVSLLQEDQIPWSVNGLASAIVPRLLEDTSFVRDTKLWLSKQLAFLTSTFDGLGFSYSPTQVNFYLLRDSLAEDQTAEKLFIYLLKNGIVARHTHNFKGLSGRYLRLAVRSEAENQLLIEQLKKWRGKL